MTDGFGAGVLTLTIMGLLAVPAGLLGLTAAAAVALRRRTGSVPTVVPAVADALLVGVVVPAGFGVLALADEAPVGAGLLVAVVFVPLVAVVGRHRESPGGWLGRLAISGLAWSVPYLLGAVVFVGLNVLVPRTFDLAPAESHAVGVGWIAATGAGVVALIGAVIVSDRLAVVLANNLRAPG